MIESAWKVWRHDFASPLQGGPPVWDGSVPWDSPVVYCDTSDDQSEPGWSGCRKASDALRIAGLWRNGRAAILTRVVADWHKPNGGDNWRAAQIRIVEIVDPTDAVLELSSAFGEHAQAMADAQMRWWRALGTDVIDEASVVSGLEAALRARGLKWSLRRLDGVSAARDAWASWAARVFQYGMDAMSARRDWDEADAIDARNSWNGSWDEMVIRESWGGLWEAMSACTYRYAALKGWVDSDPEKYEVGIIDAYASGLRHAIPTGPKELGYVMRKDEK